MIHSGAVLYFASGQLHLWQAVTCYRITICENLEVRTSHPTETMNDQYTDRWHRHSQYKTYDIHKLMFFWSYSRMGRVLKNRSFQDNWSMFYELRAIPALQPTASEYWKVLKAPTLNHQLDSSFFDTLIRLMTEKCCTFYSCNWLSLKNQ